MDSAASGQRAGVAAEVPRMPVLSSAVRPARLGSAGPTWSGLSGRGSKSGQPASIAHSKPLFTPLLPHLGHPVFLDDEGGCSHRVIAQGRG